MVGVLVHIGFIALALPGVIVSSDRGTRLLCAAGLLMNAICLGLELAKVVR